MVVLSLVGESLFDISEIAEWIILLVDYTEIPALIFVSLIYLNDLNKKIAWKPLWFLIFLNIQWLHIFWITDEIVIAKLTGGPETTILPAALAWLAILIDYLELPVMFDTIKKSFKIILDKHKNNQEVT